MDEVSLVIHINPYGRIIKIKNYGDYQNVERYLSKPLNSVLPDIMAATIIKYSEENLFHNTWGYDPTKEKITTEPIGYYASVTYYDSTTALIVIRTLKDDK